MTAFSRVVEALEPIKEDRPFRLGRAVYLLLGDLGPKFYERGVGVVSAPFQLWDSSAAQVSLEVKEFRSLRC